MAKSVELFKFLQKSYQTIGFYPSQTGQIGCSFNLKNLFILLSILQLFLSSLAFFLFEAHSLFDYGTSFYTSITNLFSLIILAIILWKMTDILMLIEKFEEYIEKSINFRKKEKTRKKR